LAHREDDDAIEALIRLSDPNSPTYPFSETEADLEAMAAILQQKLGNSGAG
jgi:hypothetical protein